MAYILLFLALLLRTIMDVSFKKSVHQLHLDGLDQIKGKLFKICKSIYLWIGVAIAIFNMGIWVLLLSQFDLSYAYPLFSLSYIFIIIAGKIVFKEKLDRPKLLGISFIAIGVVLLFI